MLVQDKFSLDTLENHFQANLAKEQNAFFKNFKQNAFEEFLRAGLPTTKKEEWKYIDLNLLFEFIFNFEKTNQKTTLQTPDLWPKDNILLLENGNLNLQLSKVNQNIVFCSLKTAQEKHFELFEKYFNKIANRDSLDLLNESFMSESLFLYIPSETTLEQPLNIFCNSNLNNSCRLLIVCDKFSKGEILINTFGQENYFANIITEIVLEDSAQFEIYYVQNESHTASQIASTYCNLKKNSVLHLHSFALGGHLSRHKIIADLNEAGSECSLNGLYVLADNNQTHNQIVLNHHKPNCRSSQLYKGILDDKARAEFSGKIRVAPNAIGTNAQQLNRNLLISPTAKVDTRPQLEIEADDVKCSHGATIGQLEEEQLFYLLSRGIDLAQAKKVLIYGFAREIIQKIAYLPLRTKLDELFLANIPIQKILV